MNILPAIDIRDGNVVRLIQGDYTQESVYAHSPRAIAEQWVEQGANMLHVVDLDGAREGKPMNLSLIADIAQNISVPVQCGGGFRTSDDIQNALDSGIARVILGTKACDEGALRETISIFSPDTIMVSLDVTNGNVKTEGWIKDSGVSLEDACKTLVSCGVRYVVCTDIQRDGMQSGSNIEMLKIVLKYESLQVIASGGIGSLADIQRLKDLDADNLFGVIIGKALYEKSFTLEDALRLL